MCGQVGVIFGAGKRGCEELNYLKKLFTYLLLLSERRGPHAAGIARIDRNGSHSIFKRPVKASDFIKDEMFAQALSGVNDKTTWLAGHTRWQTRGDVSNNANNHPIRARDVIGTHNGTILNADYLFTHLGLTRFAEVDSELIFRIADTTLADGAIDIAALKAQLALFRGQISAVMASKLDPETVVVIKGNKPLRIRYHQVCNTIVYVSDTTYFDCVLTSDLGWQEVMVKPMSLVTFHCCDLLDYSIEPFKLGRAGFQRFTGKEEV